MSSIDYSSTDSSQDTVQWTAHLVKQLNAYTTWVNSHLKKRTGSRQIHDLKLDIRDGVALIQLLETLSGEYLGGNAFPQSYNDMRDNVQRVINYMQERRIRMHQTQASDIVEGNIKSIMRLVLAVAVHYQPDSVKQSVHQQVRHDQSAVMETAQQAAVALAETRREVINLGHVVRRPELARSSDDSHADYANIDSRTHAGSTPAYPHYKSHNAGTVPVYPQSKARDMDSIDRRGSRESLDTRNANYQSHDGRNSKFRSNGSKENLDRRDSRENLDRRDSREHLDRRDSRENLDRRDSREKLDRRDSREKLDRRDLPAHDRVDGRTHSRQTAPRAVKQRSRSRDNLLETSDSDKSEIRDRRVDPRRGFVENRGVESRYAVPWRVEPRGVENRNVRNVRASSLVKSRSLDFDNVSSEDSHSEASSAASMPRSVSIQPLTSTRTPNTPTNASTAPHRTVGTRAPVRPYAPVVSLAPSLDSTRTLYTPSAPAPSLASTGANNTPTGAPVTPTGAMTSSNTTYIPPAPNTTLVDAQDVTEFSHVAHSASTSGASYPDDAMVELLDNLSVDHTDMAEDLTETKQVLLQLQNLLLQGDGEDMTSLGQDDDTTDTHDIQEELVILRKRLVQSEVASRSLHEDFARMKAENQKLLNEKTTLKQRLHDEEGTRLEMKAELIRVGLTEGTWHNERAELHKQVNEKEMFIRELKRDLAYKDRLISQLQTDLDAEIEDKENVSRHLKSQLQQLHDKMRRVGESEAQISSKLANQDQAMTRIEGKMTTQRTTPQDQTYQEEFEHMKELLLSLRQTLSRNDPQHKAMDCLEGALTRLATQIHFSITLPGRKTSDPNRRVPLDTSNEPRCSPVAAVQGFPVQHQYNKPYQPIPPRQYHDVTANTYKSDMTASTTSQGYPHGTLNTTTSQGYPNGTLNTTSQGYPHGTLNTTTSQGYPHTTLNTTTSQGYPHATLNTTTSQGYPHATPNTTTSQGYPHATPNTTTSHFSGYPHANPNNTAMSPTSQPGTKNVTSSSSVTSSSHSVTSSSQTKILYFTDTTVTPFLCTIPKRLGEITLADFKLVYDKPGKFRYHFKSMDPEFGTVKEEISCDDDVLPGWEGKVVAWIEEDHG